MRVPISKLKQIREQNFYTQDELARRSGVSRPTIARLERGDTYAYPSTLKKLACALGVTPQMLVDRNE